MINERRSILPSDDLIAKWDRQVFDEGEHLEVIYVQAYQAGADAELQECCKWADETGWVGAGTALRRLRRPKLLSLKKQAMAEVAGAVAEGNITPERAAIIRLALEQLK